MGDVTKQIGGKNTLEDVGIGAAAALTGGLALDALPAFAGGAAALGADALGAGAADAAAGAPLDLLAGGAAAGTAAPAAIGAIEPITGALASGLSLEPGFASSVAGDVGLGLAGGPIDAAGLPLEVPGATPTSGPASITGASPTSTPWSAGGVGPAGGPPPISSTGVAPGVGGGGAAPAGAAPLDLTSTIGPAGGAATPAGAPAAAPASGGSNILGQIGSFLNSPTGKGLGAVLSAGGLGYDIYSQKQQESQAQNQVKNTITNEQATAQQINAAAQPTLQQGQLLTTYLTTGTLPAPIQAQLDQATAAAKAAIIANAGQRGVSTDPTQNSALAADLAAADQQALSTKGTLEEQLQQAGQQMITTANQLISTGLSATEMSSQLQEYLINLDQTLSANTGKAIANFAAALGGGTRIGTGGQTITLSPSQ